jgi:hypothetical protein
LYEFAKEYNEGVTFLREHFGGQIKFIRPGYPRYVDGATAHGTKIAQMIEPTPPMRIPLKAYVPNKTGGRNTWACCLDEPKVLDNGLHDLGRTKSLQIVEDLLINLDKDMDLAFFIYYKSPITRAEQLKVYDADALAREIAETNDLIAERKMAVWKMLKDDKLPLLARAYGINDVTGKKFPVLRQELERQLEANDELRKFNPAVKGTKEFIEEMKVTDGVLLRAFVKTMLEENRLNYKNGIFKIGDKNVIQVPAGELKRSFDFLCQYLSTGNNVEVLQEFLKDLLSTDYLNSITEKKEWQWLFGLTGGNPQFKRPEEIQEKVKEYFCPVG